MAERIDLGTAIVALLRLAVAEREERNDSALSERKVEVLLHEAGLNNAQIATVTGKQPSAVRMAITRAEKRPQRGVRPLRSRKPA